MKVQVRKFSSHQSKFPSLFAAEAQRLLATEITEFTESFLTRAIKTL
jgi:hypothetical protein